MTYSRCENSHCNVTLHTDKNDIFLKSKNVHSHHTAEPEQTEIRTFKQNVKERTITLVRILHFPLQILDRSFKNLVRNRYFFLRKRRNPERNM
jgi:hypothetical protein